MATTTSDVLVREKPQVLAPELARPSSSLWADAWRRLLKNRAAMAGLVIIAFFLVVAIFAPAIAPHDPVEIFPGNTFRNPVWVQLPNDPEHSGDPRFLLGTDSIGRDFFSRLVYGTRTSMTAGFLPMFVILFVGILIGMVSGFAGGKIDNLLMRLTDIVYAFPDLLFFIIMMTALRDTLLGQLMSGLLLLLVSLSMVSWVTVARLVRGQVLALKQKDYVEAARMIGATNDQIMWRHLLPNSLAPIIVAAAFIVPNAILAEAILGYLGVGLRPTTEHGALFPTSWGQLLLDGRDAINAQPWMLVFPAVCIALVMLSFTFVGDGLRDAMDPMMKH